MAREEATSIGFRTLEGGADPVLTVNGSDVRPAGRIDLSAFTVANLLWKSYQQGHAAGQAARSAVLAEVLMARVTDVPGRTRTVKHITRDVDDQIQEIEEVTEPA